ncbi:MULTISPECIES: HIT family protein [Massilia]|uniref:Histidine triad (HIT) protein n=1 Tax=Massilia aurea TaxID=373040 RepID=A0A422QMU2_9BURK|nr:MULTISPECIES: HIT family protein [Massilia]MDY0965067.1 HIT family protein [Massilia sp. CFBP9026]RNF31329.1 histidine triad (HIT) protein [Massilia aurea]
MTALRELGCELCSLSMPVAWAGDKFSVIVVDDANYPGFCRVIWHDHVREMSDLSREDRLLVNEAVFLVEQAVRDVMQPLKVNVASLGNVVPHLHWHIIPRYADDAHFPAPVWAQAVRETPSDILAARRALAEQLGAAIARRFN